MTMLVRFNPFNELPRLPAVDVVEDDQKLELFADVPGVKQEDLDIQVEKDVLTIRGERKGTRQAGSFSRAFTLPKHVDVEKIAASLKDGVLTLTLPKRAEAQPRAIKVSVAA
jgi:HSP20 family protein